MAKIRTRQELIEYLVDCEKAVDNFRDKIGSGPAAFLRTATLSHLRNLSGRRGSAAEKMAKEVLDDFCNGVVD